MPETTALDQTPGPARLELLNDQLADHLLEAAHLRGLLPAVAEVADLVVRAFGGGHRLYTFGNGGSAADAQHLATEFVGRYRRRRRPLPAVALTVDPSALTCIGNDFDFDEVFARQVSALAGPGDVVAAFTTSGRSGNVVRGLHRARERGASTVLFAAGDGADAAAHADHLLLAPGNATARIQEMHLLMLHMISEVVDDWAASTESVP